MDRNYSFDEHCECIYKNANDLKYKLCSDIFEAIDLDHKKCFNRYLTTNPQSIKYQLEIRSESRVLYDEDGNLIHDSCTQTQKIGLLDYAIAQCKPYFLKSLIDRDCLGTRDIEKLFEIFNYFDRSDKFDTMSRVEQLRYLTCIFNAVLCALKKGWYRKEKIGIIENIENTCPYLLKLIKLRFILYEKIIDQKIYKSVILKLLDYGETVFDTDKNKIKNYVCHESKFSPSYRDSGEKKLDYVINELFEYVEEWNSYSEDIKEPSID